LLRASSIEFVEEAALLLAFSGVTARNGVILLGLGYLSAATEPSTFTLENPTLIAFVAISILIAIAAFVVPMRGMHLANRPGKSRLAADANRDLGVALTEISRRPGRATSRTPTRSTSSYRASSSNVTSSHASPRWPWQPATVRRVLDSHAGADRALARLPSHGFG